jgi:all-trans-retinol 13,14-reductase
VPSVWKSTSARANKGLVRNFERRLSYPTRAPGTHLRACCPAAALPFDDQLKSPPEGFEVIELFLGLRRDPREMGFHGENYWMFESFDHDEMYAQRNELLNGRAAMAYLSFPSLRDRQAQSHTAEIIAPLSYRSLEAHRHEPWRRRGAEYDSAKDRITRALLDLVERHHPGFGDLVEYSELATPLSFEHFTAAPSGAIYGYPATPEKYGKTWLGPRTPIQNLYLTGSDVAFPGIMGAVLGAVVTASCLLGVRFPGSNACRELPLIRVG